MIKNDPNNTSSDYYGIGYIQAENGVVITVEGDFSKWYTKYNLSFIC